MRRFFFILMIMLLPLQGWTSVAMSTEMATMQLSTQSHSAASSTVKMSPECAFRMSAASSQDTENDDASNKLCTDCQACHLIALTEPVQIIIKTTFSRSFERSARHYFASADLQFNQKPPIFTA
jgi:hypothetical protein